jgi:uncharacterized protein (TIGR03435 family)
MDDRSSARRHGDHKILVVMAFDLVVAWFLMGVSPWEMGPFNSVASAQAPAPQQSGPQPVKPMAADADPSFEVATIKPNTSGDPEIHGPIMKARHFNTQNASVSDLIEYAYSIQKNQIVGGPAWIDKNRYDISAVPAQEGEPSHAQDCVMVRKLLADRFKLIVHHEKRELPAFVLTLGEHGQKLAPTQISQSRPSINLRPGPKGLTLDARNASMADFAYYLLTFVLERPVVDQTGLTGKFDFQFTFAPDDSQFKGHPPQLPEVTESSPGLFDAMQQQVGLKLKAGKAPVDVIVIDHLEPPSED